MKFLQRLAEIALARVQLKIYDREILNKYETLFDTELFGIKEMLKDYEDLMSQDSAERAKYQELIKLCGGTESARWLVDFCLTALLYPEFHDFSMEYWNGITLDAVSGYVDEEFSYKEAKQTAECAKRILKCQKKGRVFLRHQFWADERLLDFFLDEYSIDTELKKIGTEVFTGEEVLEETFVGKKIQEQLEHILQEKNVQCVQIAGNTGCGKRFLLKKACETTNQQMIMVNMSKITEKKHEDAVSYADLVIREALLLKCGICFYGVSNHLLEAIITYFIKPALRNGIRVYLCTTLDTELIAMMDEHVDKVIIAPYGRNERIALWEGFSKDLGIYDQVDCITAGSKFKLSAKEIKKAADRIAKCETAGHIRESEISQICEDVLLNPTCGSIKRIHVQYTLDDLKLWPEQKRILNNICSHVWHRHKVYDDWNMDSRYAYGKNVSALFYGPPGTGKTMAVHVLANMLNLPLYRIDLSQVVDKYIGETEKRLEEIFDAAEKNNTVLFFDEADSIFGKRSEVNEAKDKYANTEVSYILQRIEQYDGIVILATNYRKNIDEAFMRRIRYVVEFSLPDKELRKELWKTSFSKEIPTEGLNFDYLAEQFELAGGAIKNIVLNASFLAASENRPVGMVDVLRSVRNENVKIGKVMLSKDFGLYEELMEEADKNL